MPELALYIHIPWCVQKCPYCDFNSHEARQNIPEKDYIEALVKDLEQDLPLVWGRRIGSIFFGGGTPSLFSATGIDRLLSDVRSLIPIKPDAEITLEANPGTVEHKKFDGFREAGVNRLSIGVQSFDDSCLQALGRIHDSGEARRAVESARDAGFENINIDLMFGLPGQSHSLAIRDIEQAVSLEPTHISYYQLTIEPNTMFHVSPPVLPGDDEIWEYQIQGQAALASHGYKQYETSAYAREGRQCQHNINYWKFGDYLGIGAGAHSKVTDANQQSVTRYAKVKHPLQYLQKVGQPVRLMVNNRLSRDDVILEFMMNALRLTNGFNVIDFENNTGLQFDVLQPTLTEAVDKGLIKVDQESRVVLATELGQRYLNELLQLFMPQDS